MNGGGGSPSPFPLNLFRQLGVFHGYRGACGDRLEAARERRFFGVGQLRRLYEFIALADVKKIPLHNRGERAAGKSVPHPFWSGILTGPAIGVYSETILAQVSLNSPLVGAQGQVA